MIIEVLRSIDPDIEIDTPPKNIDADYALKVFRIAKREKKNPKEIALEIYEKVKKIDFIKKVDVVGPYVNVKIAWSKVFKKIVGEIINKNYFKFEKKNVRILVEHTSANPNKALHIGHLRNFALGDSLSKLLKFVGYNVQILNYIDDTGLQVADTVLGFFYLGFPENPSEFKVEKWIRDFKKKLDERGIHLDERIVEEAKKIVLDRLEAYREIYGKIEFKKFDQYSTFVYVVVNKLYNLIPELEKLRREILRKIEEGNNEIAEFSRRFVEKILKCQLETIWRFDVYYDLFNKESDIVHFGFWDAAFELLKKRNVVKYIESGEKAGTWCIDLSRWEGFEEVKDKLKVLVRSDGTIVYLAKDIGYALWKHGLINKDFLYKIFLIQPNGSELWITNSEGSKNPKGFGHADISINVIGREQSYLQKIISKIIQDLDPNKKYVHYSYELVMLSKDTAKTLGYDFEAKTVKMSTRKGLEIDIDSLFEKLKEKVMEEFNRRGQEIDDNKAEKIVKSILRYEMIKLAPDRPLVFDMKKALSLEENSAIYLLYTYARANSIIEKAGDIVNRLKLDEIDIKGLLDIEEKIVKLLHESKYVLEKASKNLKLNQLSDYIYNLALVFNEFYQNVPVIKEISKAPHRIFIVQAVVEVMNVFFDILGIEKIRRF